MQTKEEKKAKRAVYYAANREKILVQTTEYYAAHKEERKAYRASNKEKRGAYNAAYHAAHVEEISARKAARHAADPERSKGQHRKSSYGVSQDCFQLMLAVQQNACGICKEPFVERTPSIDHCHKTGEVRGLLCRHCNRLLGAARDSLEILENAKEYLQG